MAQILEIAPKRDLSVLKRIAELYESGEVDHAFAMLEPFLLDTPNDPQVVVLAAGLMKKARKITLAYQLAHRAVQLAPDKCETWGTLGHCAQLMWLQEEAWSAYRKALQRARTKEQEALYESNLASVLLDTGKFCEAEPRLRRALALTPQDTHAQHNLGLVLLSQRRWAEGWPLYSSSMGTDNRVTVKYRNPAEPVWDGTPGRSIVVSGEQGLGDEICAASMLADVMHDCRHVIIDCDKRLEGLFRRSFTGASVYGTRWAKPTDGVRWKEGPEAIEASISGFEVGRFYRKSDVDFPGMAYLVPCKERSLAWKARFALLEKPIIGIAWTGGIRQNAGLHRQLPLAEWKPIFESADAHWVSLQYKDASAEIQGTPVVQYPWATLTKDYDDTAALVDACDLIIGMQTTVCHLAGALGKPVWTLIPTTSQWRYGEEGDTVPWYHSMKLYRQKNGWDSVVKRIAGDLRAHQF